MVLKPPPQGLELLGNFDQVEQIFGDRVGTQLLLVCQAETPIGQKSVKVVLQALTGPRRPDHAFYVDSHEDPEVPTTISDHLDNDLPSAPAIVLCRDGHLVYQVSGERLDGQATIELVEELMCAFSAFCACSRTRGRKRTPRLPLVRFRT